jgi:2',3'-cyclic-nucleotide 2'-phosphodiesterase/3'-nucleotidase/5'-nucleotidase
LVQAGDAVGASRPVSALLQDEPTIRFLNELGFDVGTVGNNEFDEGVTEMLRLINGGPHAKTQEQYGSFEGASFPYVAANLEYVKSGKLVLPPYAVKEVDGVKVGFIGVVTTETPSIVTASGTAGVNFTDETMAINKYAKELRDQGVKTIVVLAHDPGTSAIDGSNPTGKVVDIAKALNPNSGVDVFFGAHDHKYLNSTVNGILLVQSYSYWATFFDVDLTIDPVTQDVVAKQAEIVSTFHKGIEPDAQIKAELDQYQADVAPITNQPVGEAAVAMTRTANAAGKTALGNLVADGMRATTNTDFAFMNVGGIRTDLDKGPITWGELFAIQPFGNDLVTLKLTGEQIRILLNQQLSTAYARIMQISGLRYTWNDKLPKGEKVLDIFLPNGKKINPKAEYTVTVNNFMADGGEGFVILKQGKDRKVSLNELDAFVNYVKAQPQSISAKIEGRILLADSTTVVNPPADPGTGNGQTTPTPSQPLPNTAT